MQQEKTCSRNAKEGFEPTVGQIVGLLLSDAMKSPLSLVEFFAIIKQAT
jgi:hypothetical protein